MEWLLDPNGFLTFAGYQSYAGKVQLRELRWTRGALCTELWSLWILWPRAIMEFLWLGRMKDKRLIQSALDLNLIDCGKGTRCESVSMMYTVVSSSIYSVLPVVECSCLLAKVYYSDIIEGCDVKPPHREQWKNNILLPKQFNGSMTTDCWRIPAM